MNTVKGRHIDKMIGKMCKIVVCEPGERDANVTNGVIRDVDHEQGLVFVESLQGSGVININTILAIKPRKLPLI
jgi:hypothetical protein